MDVYFFKNFKSKCKESIIKIYFRLSIIVMDNRKMMKHQLLEWFHCAWSLFQLLEISVT